MPTPISSPDAHKDVARRYVEAFNRGDMEALRQLLTPDAVVQGVRGWFNIDDALSTWQQLHEAFAIELTIEEMLAEGNSLAARCRERGKFVGPFHGHQPTGQSYELIAIEWFTFRAGKISRRWGVRDTASQAQQIGLER